MNVSIGKFPGQKSVGTLFCAWSKAKLGREKTKWHELRPNLSSKQLPANAADGALQKLHPKKIYSFIYF